MSDQSVPLLIVDNRPTPKAYVRFTALESVATVTLSLDGSQTAQPIPLNDSGSIPTTADLMSVGLGPATYSPTVTGSTPIRPRYTPTDTLTNSATALFQKD